MEKKGYPDGIVRYPVSVAKQPKSAYDWIDEQETPKENGVIEGIKEVENFLEGISDADTLKGLLSQEAKDRMEAIAGLKINQLETPMSGENVYEEYELLNKEGDRLGTTIKIYKDQSLYDVDFTDSNGEKSGQFLKFIYIIADGSHKTVYVDLSRLIDEKEIGDGLQVYDHVISVKLDVDSEEFLTITKDGIKLSGIQNTIDAVKEDMKSQIDAEKERAEKAEEAIRETVAGKADETELSAYVKKSGDEMSGSFKFNLPRADSFVLKRTASNSSACIDFYGNNQDTIGTRFGGDGVNRFFFALLDSGTPKNILEIERSGEIKSLAEQGTAPISVASTTVCPNLNADMVDGLHGNELIRTYEPDSIGIKDGNIDDKYPESFVTFDGTNIGGDVPSVSPNISVLNIGGHFDRRKQLAFPYNENAIYFRRHIDGNWSSWKRLAFTDSTVDEAKNANTVAMHIPIGSGTDAIIKRGYVAAYTTLSSYWFRLATITNPVSGTNTDITLFVNYTSTDITYAKWAILNIKLRYANTIYDRPRMFFLAGNISKEDIRLYYKDKDTNPELWVNTNAIYRAVQATVLLEGTLTNTLLTNKISFNEGYYNTEQTPELSDYILANRIASKAVNKRTASGAISIDGATYDVEVITLNGNVSGITLSAMPLVGQDVGCLLYGNGDERTVVIANNATYKTPTGENIEITVPAEGYAEINFFYDGQQIWVRGV